MSKESFSTSRNLQKNKSKSNKSNENNGVDESEKNGSLKTSYSKRNILIGKNPSLGTKKISNKVKKNKIVKSIALRNSEFHRENIAKQLKSNMLNRAKKTTGSSLK